MKPDEIYKKKNNILNKNDKEELWSIIKPICSHKEFIKRCNKPYYHHDEITLGEHIISDAIMTYILAKNSDINVKTAVAIAMFHDLYEVPWQNAHDHKKLMNKHGFVHPIEAIINAITWYPEYFKDDETTKVIIDGVIHHMYPLPVRSLKVPILDLNNLSKYNELDDKYKKMIEKSANRKSIGKISLCKSKYKEGRIMSKADKKVALGKEIKKPGSFLRLIHGNNKKIAK